MEEIFDIVDEDDEVIRILQRILEHCLGWAC